MHGTTACGVGDDDWGAAPSTKLASPGKSKVKDKTRPIAKQKRSSSADAGDTAAPKLTAKQHYAKQALQRERAASSKDESTTSGQNSIREKVKEIASTATGGNATCCGLV